MLIIRIKVIAFFITFMTTLAASVLSQRVKNALLGTAKLFSNAKP